MHHCRAGALAMNTRGGYNETALLTVLGRSFYFAQDRSEQTLLAWVCARRSLPQDHASHLQVLLLHEEGDPHPTVSHSRPGAKPLIVTARKRMLLMEQS